MENSKYDAAFCDMVKYAYPKGVFGRAPEVIMDSGKASMDYIHLSNLWWSPSFAQNLDGLGIRDKLERTLGLSPTTELMAAE